MSANATPFPSEARGSVSRWPEVGIHLDSADRLPNGLEFVILLAVVFPYVSPLIRFPAEVQPWAPLLAWATVTWMAITRIRTPRMRRENLALVIFGIIFLVHVNPAINASLFYIRRVRRFYSEPDWCSSDGKCASLTGQVVLLATTVYAFFAVLNKCRSQLSGQSYHHSFRPRHNSRVVVPPAAEATDWSAVYLFLFALRCAVLTFGIPK